MKIYIPKTDKLILHLLSVDDAEAVYVWVSDERVIKYMTYLSNFAFLGIEKFYIISVLLCNQLCI
ncbi:hypothetical protein JYG23_01035 [Sedimentibacter sp. zth1]|uniref:hypothetical protein n=1 Tax=Sedimentibacter sp. zth1 TaxID=2816908 RepID=UPI001A939C69|nr:hypothetical protein [Sedimentibacter sp. zth1]QSX06081.1 hypothetical protein JYG23_01035 [Sedimentibacter sp. zth1]